MDMALPLEERTSDKPAPFVYNSRCIIDACRPAHWDPNIKKSITYSPELQAQIREKFGDVLFPKDKPSTAEELAY